MTRFKYAIKPSDSSLRSNHLGEVLRERRMALGLTQAAVAAQVGVAAAYYCRMERGTARPNVKNLYALSLALKTRCDELLGLDMKCNSSMINNGSCDLDVITLVSRILSLPPEAQEIMKGLVNHLHAYEMKCRKQSA